MSRKNLRSNFIKERVNGVEIVDISDDGKGIGKKEGEVFFVKGAVPGERVDIEVYAKKKSVKEGSILECLDPSPLRAEPFCKHFGECGGCKWQHLSYPGQLYYKEKQVRDALERIGKLDKEVIEKILKPIFPSENTRYYRNKLEFTFTHRRWKSRNEMDSQKVAIEESAVERIPSPFSPGLGFHVPGSFDKILDIHYCFLQAEPSNSIRNRVKNFCEENQIPFFNLRDQTGLMRNLMIRTTSTGETMVLVIFAYLDQGIIPRVMDFIHKEFPEANSLQYIINSKKNDTLMDQEVIPYSGPEYIQERMGALKFRISAKSFYQTNSLQAEKLYALAKTMAGFNGNELVYDLYTGTGTIANYIASSVKKVIGLEYVEVAIEDAKINAQDNGIQNAEFYCGDIKDLLTPAFTYIHGLPDIILTDPPRAGMHPDVVESLIQMRAKKIVYISCNPSTQARDLIRLQEVYEIKEIRPVDMFPQTQHVENLVLLELKNNPLTNS